MQGEGVERAVVSPEGYAGRNHRDLIPFLALMHNWRSGAELGLASGLLMARLMEECPNLKMIGVDLFRKPERMARVLALSYKFSDRMKIHGMSTNRAAKLVPDGTLDFVFIDAGHGYEAVRDDIKNWSPKLKPTGILMGHDYDPVRHPGVVAAVHQAFGDGFTLLPHTVWLRR